MLNMEYQKVKDNTFTIGQISKELNISIDTLRYYEKSGITPTIQRDKNGYRVYNESDKKWLGFVNCLKSTGMPLNKIKQYLNYMENMDDTILLRRELIVEHQKKIEKELKTLQDYLEKIHHKVEFYDELIESHGLNHLNL